MSVNSGGSCIDEGFPRFQGAYAVTCVQHLSLVPGKIMHILENRKTCLDFLGENYCFSVVIIEGRMMSMHGHRGPRQPHLDHPHHGGGAGYGMGGPRLVAVRLIDLIRETVMLYRIWNLK